MNYVDFVTLTTSRKLFELFSYDKKETDGRHFGSANIEFRDDSVILHDGYEWDDHDGDRILEGDEYCTINKSNYEKILSVVPDEFKKADIVTDNQKSTGFSARLDDSEKKLFICILNYNKSGQVFGDFIRTLKDNKIEFEHRVSRYP